MTVLVIGGTGFIGRSIVNKLMAQNIAVTVLTRSKKKLSLFSKPVPFIIGDLLDFSHLDLSSYQQIINCSGEIHNEQLMRKIHVTAIEQLLNKIQVIPGLHWIQISSVGVYGKIRSGVVKEDCVFAPVGEYEQTKADGEMLIKEFCFQHKINYTIIRPSNVFGHGMPNHSLMQLIKMIKRKLFLYIGTNVDKIMMNYVPVEDVADFTITCLNNKNAINQDFIISDELPLLDFVAIVCEGLAIKNSFYQVPEGIIRYITMIFKFIPRFPITPSRVDALTTQAIYSTAKAKITVNFSPKIGLSYGLKEYISKLALDN